ncbi:hypothetical protein BKA93DRAFT_389108 [Sparassis latifolia]
MALIQPLQNDDILREVFRVCHFRLEDDSTNVSDGPDLKDLARSARVCKAFSEHALDTLWSDLDKVLPLLKVLTTSFALVQENDSRSTYNLRGSIPEAELLRFRHYAKRVHEITVDYEKEQISPSVFAIIAHFTRGTPLFTSLSRLIWRQSHPLGSELLLFTSPSLLHFKVHAHSALPINQDSTFNLVMSILASSIPSLQSLDVHAAVHRLPVMQDIAQLRCLRKLSITCPVSARSVVANLAGMEKLAEIILALDTSEINGMPSRSGFLPLGHLQIIGGRLSGVKHILQAIDPATPLQSFELHCLDPLRKATRELNSILAMLSQAERINSMRRIGIYCDFVHELVDYSRYMDVLQPLQCLQFLEDVQVTFGAPAVSFTDDDIRDMTKSWPRLITLIANYSEGNIISISSLLEFALHCPDLRELSLTNGRLGGLPSIDLETVPILSHGLHMLEICHDWHECTPDHIRQCALFLYRIFPNIEDCRCVGHHGAPPMVYELLADFQSVRKMELARVGNMK